MVKHAYKRCSQKELLLDFILVEEIIDLAKRAIRFTPIETYENLFETLRQNIGIISSNGLSCSKLETIKQVPTESVQNFNLRFRQ